MGNQTDFERAALVLFSGGQDSATCLAWALDKFDRVETIGFDYGQRHRVELDCRTVVREKIVSIQPDWDTRLGLDHCFDMTVLGDIGDTAMTKDVEITFDDARLPNTFVPGRNLIFFNFAAALAYRRGIKHLVGGMCETDYSGYPDCRDDTLKSLQATLNLGMESRFVLHTPLMWIDKQQTWEMARHLGGEVLVQLIIDETHTCYLGNRQLKHAWGVGCENCPACELRSAGYDKWITSRVPR